MMIKDRKNPIKYIFRVVKKNWKNKNFWKSVFIATVVTNYFKFLVKNKGIYIINEDWDNLIILDACRYDLFEKVINQPVNFRISRGSSTTEFLVENFSKKRYDDIVYISANPYINKIVPDAFYKVIPIWKHKWEESLGTVLPESVTGCALDIEKQYPDKRLIIHFMQPHIPFIANPELNQYKGEKSTFHIVNDGFVKINCNPWKAAADGEISFSEAYDAYKNNLKAVLPFAIDLSQKLSGKTVITSDHGEALKDKAHPFPITIWEHPSYVHIEALVKVPWLEMPFTNRKVIKPGGLNSKINKKIIRKVIQKLQVKK